MRKLAIRDGLVLAALLMGGVHSVHADTENAADYIRIVGDGKIDYSKPYVDFEYPDYDTQGINDAFTKITINVLHFNTVFPLAEMPRCHDELTCDTRYGYVSIMGTYEHPEEKGLRIVKARYYPTAVGMSGMTGLSMTGWWDVDDNGSDTDDYFVEKIMPVDCKWQLGAQYDPGKLQLYRHPEQRWYLAIDYDATSFSDEYVKAGYQLKAKLSDGPKNSEPSSVGDCDLNFGEKEKGVPFSWNPLHDKDKSTVHAMFSYYRKVTVRNGSEGSRHDESVELLQEFSGPSASHTIDGEWFVDIGKISPIREEGGLRLTDIVQSSHPRTGEGIRVSRRNMRNGNVDAKVLGVFTGEALSHDIIDTTALPCASYVYDICYGLTGADGFVPQEIQHMNYRALHFLHGDGDSDNPFLLESAIDLRKAANWCRSTPHEPLFFRLDRDIVIPDSFEWRSFGGQYVEFYDSFDGDGHTVTFSLDTEQGDEPSLFGKMRDCDVNRLRLHGDIVSSDPFTGAFAQNVEGVCFNHCEADVNIYAQLNGTCHFGTFVGEVALWPGRSSKFYYCMAGGLIANSPEYFAHGCGGFVGIVRGNASPVARFYNCFSMAVLDMSEEDSDVFAHGKAKAVDCYYLGNHGNNGLDASELTDRERGLALCHLFGTEYLNYTEEYPQLRVFRPSEPSAVLSSAVDFVLKSDYGKSFPKVLLNRDFTARKLYSWYYPFVPDRKIGTFYAYYYSEYLTNRVYFVRVPDDQELKSHVPYLYQPSAEGAVSSPIFSDVSILPPPDATSDLTDRSSWNGFAGTYSRIELPLGVHVFDEATGTFKFVKEPVELLPHQVCLNVFPLIGEVELVLLDEKIGGTGVEQVVGSQPNSRIYLPSGVRTDRLHKGVNIVNGKKIYVR